MKLSELREKMLIKTKGEGKIWDDFVILTYKHLGVLPASCIFDDFDLPVEFLKLVKK